MAWIAWPNSWNSVSASSSEISTGSPAPGLLKLLLLDEMTRCGGASPRCERYALAQAPDRLPARAKSSR